jgi:hypothetical protein
MVVIGYDNHNRSAAALHSSRSRAASQQRCICRDNEFMTVFYWVMGVLIVGTFVPSVLFLVMYAVTGDNDYGNRAKGFWTYARLFTMFGVNILIWGHVAVGLWQIWFK